MAESSRVTIIAELQDKLTGPLQKAKKSVEDTTKSVDKHGKTADKSFGIAAKSAEEAAKTTVRSGAKLEKALDSAGSSAIGMSKDFGRAENKVAQALGGMATDAKESASKIDRAFANTGKVGGAKMVTNFKNQGNRLVSEAKSVAARVEEAFSNINMPPVAGMAGGVGLVGGVTATLQRDSITRSIAAANGEDPKATRNLIESAYRDNFGADFASISASGNAIIGTFDFEPGSDEAAALIRGNSTLAQVYGLGEDQLAIGVKVLMEMDDITAQQATDVIGGALQKAVPGARDELLDNLTEYIPVMEGSGMSGTFMADFMAGATHIGGAYGSDKAGDLMKEFLIIANDPSKDQEAAYKQLGLDAGEIEEMISQGKGDEAFKMVMDAVAKADPADQGRLAIGVFGTPAEDLGIENIEEYNKIVQSANTEASAFAGTMKGMQDTMAEGPGAAFGKMIRTAGESIVAIGDEIAPYLTPFFEALTALAPAVGPLMILFAGISAARWGAKGARALADALGDIDKKGGKANGSMKGLRGTMIGHPVLTAAAAVYLTGEAMGYLYDESELVRGAMNGIADAMDRIEANRADLTNAVDDAASEKLGLENNGGYEEYKEAKNADIRPGWWKDAMRPLEEGLGAGPQSKEGEGWLRWMPWLQEQPAEEKHADGGWTSGNKMYRAGERGQEFIMPSTAATKIEASSPGALAAMSATGNIPTAAPISITIDARGASQGVGPEIEAAVDRALARAQREAKNNYSDRSKRGGR